MQLQTECPLCRQLKHKLFPTIYLEIRNCMHLFNKYSWLQWQTFYWLFNEEMIMQLLIFVVNTFYREWCHFLGLLWFDILMTSDNWKISIRKCNMIQEHFTVYLRIAKIDLLLEGKLSRTSLCWIINWFKVSLKSRSLLTWCNCFLNSISSDKTAWLSINILLDVNYILIFNRFRISLRKVISIHIYMFQPHT